MTQTQAAQLSPETILEEMKKRRHKGTLMLG